MSYPKPRSFVDAEKLAAAKLNIEIRDAMKWLLGHSEYSFPFASVRRATSFALPSAQFVPITFDTIEVSRGSMFATSVTVIDTVTVSTSSLICTMSGFVAFGGCVEIDAASCNKAVRLVQSGSVIAEQDTSGVGSSAVGRINIATAVNVAAGDFLEIEAFQDSGVSLNVSSQGNYSPKLWGCYVAIGD
jgi:hypothetical protein